MLNDELRSYLVSEEFVAWYHQKMIENDAVSLRDVRRKVHEHFDSDCYDFMFADTDRFGWSYETYNLIREKI